MYRRRLNVGNSGSDRFLRGNLHWMAKDIGEPGAEDARVLHGVTRFRVTNFWIFPEVREKSLKVDFVIVKYFRDNEFKVKRQPDNKEWFNNITTRTKAFESM